MVVAAETGSGKTHGYLVPLIDKLCQISDSSGAITGQDARKHNRLSLVLCPNVMLCEQVVRMANSLCNDSGTPLLSIAAVCGRQVSILIVIVYPCLPVNAGSFLLWIRVFFFFFA